jgi:hypothetical protein
LRGRQFERRDGGVGQRGHDDRAVEEALGRRHAPQDRRLAPAAGLAEHGDVARVSTEARDVVADPLQRQHDVLHTEVGGPREALGAHVGQVQNPNAFSQCVRTPPPVVLSRQGFAVVENQLPDPCSRPRASTITGRRPVPTAGVHVQAQAVLPWPVPVSMSPISGIIARRAAARGRSPRP